jgi:hypothetical protein
MAIIRVPSTIELKGGKARLHLLQENFEARGEYKGVQGSTKEVRGEYEGSTKGVRREYERSTREYEEV